jgi:hypothetical protein
MNIRSALVNEYTVGGSLLLVGFGFFSTRFADILSYQVTSVTSAVHFIGGQAVTVGRFLGIVPATLGLAVLLRKARDVPVVDEVAEMPIVKTIVNYVDDLNEDMTAHIEITPGQSGNFPLPMNSEEMAAEEALFCAEHDDYFQACGCGSMAAKPVVEVKAAEVKSTSGSPKQQAWRSCVRDAKGDMAKAKQMYTSMGY